MRLDLKAERMNRGLSLAALSEKTGVPTSTLARIETTDIEPAPKTKLALASFYGFEVVELWPVEQESAA